MAFWNCLCGHVTSAEPTIRQLSTFSSGPCILLKHLTALISNLPTDLGFLGCLFHSPQDSVQQQHWELAPGTEIFSWSLWKSELHSSWNNTFNTFGNIINSIGKPSAQNLCIYSILSLGTSTKDRGQFIRDLDKVRKTPTAISSLATPEKPRNRSKRVLYFVYRNKLLMQMYWCDNYTKMQHFGLILTKKDFLDSFHSFHKYLLSTYNVSGYWARPEDLMPNKKNSLCSHGAHGWMDQKDVNQKIPAKEQNITIWNKCCEGKEDGKSKEGWKVMLELSSEIWE